MPPLPPVPQVMKIEMTGTFEDTTWANIFHYTNALTSPTVSNMGDLATEFAAKYNSRFNPLLANTHILTKVVATDLTSAFGSRDEIGVSDAGSSSASVWTADVAICL